MSFAPSTNSAFLGRSLRQGSLQWRRWRREVLSESRMRENPHTQFDERRVETETRRPLWHRRNTHVQPQRHCATPRIYRLRLSRLRKKRVLADGAANGSSRPSPDLQDRSCERAESARKRSSAEGRRLRRQRSFVYQIINGSNRLGMGALCSWAPVLGRNAGSTLGAFGEAGKSEGPELVRRAGRQFVKPALYFGTQRACAPHTSPTPQSQSFSQPFGCNGGANKT